MTLNITVATERCIYQSADYRLQDVLTKKTYDFRTQKLALINNSRWSATVCFAGVGRTATVDVSEWLAERIAAIEFADPFERLLDELKTADAWLSKVPPPHNRHSFSIGAFVGTQPVFALVSNFENPNGPPSPIARSNLSVFELRPTKPRTFISGQKQAVTRPERRRLETLVKKDPEAKHVYAALAEINRTAAKRSSLISPACFTGHVRLTGEGGGKAHDIGNRPFTPNFAFPPSLRDGLKEVLDKQFGPGRARLVEMVFARSEPTEEHHQTQLREKPNDPSAHSNYGAFLKDIKKDTDGAEREYRKALDLDANHVNALGNLANLLCERENHVEAVTLYQKALQIDPGNENVTWNYARFLSREANNLPQALQLLKNGMNTHPDSCRLLVLSADLSLRAGTEDAILDALEGYRSARGKGADQAKVEAGYAYALQMSGASVGSCIAAYQVAIPLNPENAALKLNLAQLLFVKADNVEANKELQKALTLGLDESAQLEAQFYLLAHTSSDPAKIFMTIKRLLRKGARLRWNVQRNIEAVRGDNRVRAERLTLLSKVMEGQTDQAFLDQLLSQWA